MTHFYILEEEIKPEANGNEYQRYAFILNKFLNNFNQDSVKRNLLLQEFIASIKQDKDLKKWYMNATMDDYYSKIQFTTDDTAKRFLLSLKINNNLMAIEEDKPQQKNRKSS